jgi:hypothetical protein
MLPACFGSLTSVLDEQAVRSTMLTGKFLLRRASGLRADSGAFTDELPAPGFDPQHPRVRDLWIPGMAQTLSAVLPAVHQEFEIDYAAQWYERFGLEYYGCCEPLDGVDSLIAFPDLSPCYCKPV